MKVTRNKQGYNARKADPLQKWELLVLALLLLIGSVAPSSAQTIPAATASTSSTIMSSFPNPAVGRLATNSRGDLFYVNGPYGGNDTLYRLPHGSTTPIALATGLVGLNAFVDASDNVYVPNSYGTTGVLEVPFNKGAYSTGTAVSSASVCSSYTPASPCIQFASVGAAGGYYYQPVDMGIDAAGNVYLLDVYPNGDCAGNCVIKFARSSTTDTNTYNTTAIISNITAVNTNAKIAVDPAGDVFYSDGTVLYAVTAGTNRPIAFGSGITTPNGVSTDSIGNLYVTNSASPYDIFEFPVLNQTVQTNSQFPVVNTYAGNAVAVDTLGEMFSLGYNGSGSNLNVAHLNGISLGSSPVGTPVSTAGTTVNFAFTNATTLGGVTYTGTAAGFSFVAGSCGGTGSYTASGSCNVTVNYTPTTPGLQVGAINLTDASGATIASASLSGVGIGAAQTNDPGTVSAVGGGFGSPRAVAVDAAGTAYVADAAKNTVLVFPKGSATGTSVGSGLLAPTSVALDNAGNLFIADGGNGRIVEVPNYNGTLTTSAQTTILSKLGSTLGLAMDFAGNLYVADATAAAAPKTVSITMLPNVGGAPSSSTTVALGSFKAPVALATDLNGNLFVADSTDNSVTRIDYIGRAVTPISTSFLKPTALATDASGSVYVADSGNNRVVKVPLEGTTYNTNDQYLVSSSVASPYGVAVDSAANLYVTDSTNASVSYINRTAGLLPLGRAQVQTSSSALNATIANAGTSTLTFGTPLYTAVSATPTYFNVTSPSGSGCAAGTSLSSGLSCLLSATFTPQTTGNFTDVLTFASNAVNAASKTLTLTGRGLDLAPDTLTLTQTSASATFGQPVTIRAAVTSTVTGTPTGAVSFTVDGNSQSTAPAVNASGIATITLANLTGGQHNICGSYTGDDNYRPANSCVTVTVAKVGSATSLVITGASTTPVSSTAGAASTLTATVVGGASTPVTGNVTFSVGSQTLGTAPVSAGVATLSTTALPTGNITVTATYNGDVNYTPSSGAATDIVTYPTFVITPSAPSITVGSVASQSINLTVTALGGYGAYIGLQCKGLPANTICTFSPNQFILSTNTPQTVTMTVSTGQTPVVAQPVVTASFGTGSRFTLWSVLMLAPLTFWARRRLTGRVQKATLTALALLLLMPAAAMFSGCGGSVLFGNTPTGTSAITIVGVGTGSSNYNSSTFAPGCVATSYVSSGNTINAGNCTETAAVSVVVQ